jgi:uncharacterized protein (TIGR03118 family)
MKTNLPRNITLINHRFDRRVNSFGIPGSGIKGVFAFLFVFLIVLYSCNRFPDKFIPVSHESKVKYQQTNLVSDTAVFNAARLDSNLVNAWGIAINPTGKIWISSNGKGLTVVYDKDGAELRLPVAMNVGGPNGGTPSGAVFNTTTDFIIPATGEVSKFIFAAEDGRLYAWSSGDSTRIVADMSSTGAVYKGLEIAEDGGSNFIYATNFHNGTIDVFDKDFNFVSKPFMDQKIPMGFAPFNIRLIDGLLYVTYAKQLAPDNHDDEKGPGNGFVDIFNTDGSLIGRLVTMGKLNSPWGIEKAPEGFGQGKNAILIGNFGDGRINVYCDINGEFKGSLKALGSDMPLSIDGLWAITFPDGRIPGDDPAKLYFTAGPFGESHSLFGYITKQEVMNTDN